MEVIKHWDPHFYYGTQWGIFATQDIPERVLIGEYATDILRGTDMILCRKLDSVMEYTGNTLPSDAFLAPKNHAGYITLVNSGSNA